MENTLLHDVVRTLYFHAVVFSIANSQSLEVPIVSEMIDVNASSHLEFFHLGMMHSRTIDDDFFSRYSPHIASLFGRSSLFGNLDTFANHVSATMYPYRITRFADFHGLVYRKQWRRFHTAVLVISRCADMDGRSRNVQCPSQEHVNNHHLSHAERYHVFVRFHHLKLVGKYLMQK